jgi:hypothetical protein
VRAGEDVGLVGSMCEVPATMRYLKAERRKRLRHPLIRDTTSSRTENSARGHHDATPQVWRPQGSHGGLCVFDDEVVGEQTRR